jgi:flagellar basal body P-ring formation protein FlgA
MKLKFIPFLFSSICFVLSSTISVANTLTGEMIYNQIVEQLAKQNLNANPSISMVRHFPICPSRVSVNKIFGSWKTVSISCPGTNWRLVVRTNINKNLYLIQKNKTQYNAQAKMIVALNTSLNKGDILKDAHLTQFESTKNVGGGVFYEKDQLTGRTLKKSLSVGTIIRARHLNPDWIIHKYQVVTIEHQVGSIIINAQGIAQEAGQKGQRIWVNNFNSGKKVLCWIIDDKKVTTNAKVY